MLKYKILQLPAFVAEAKLLLTLKRRRAFGRSLRLSAPLYTFSTALQRESCYVFYRVLIYREIFKLKEKKAPQSLRASLSFFVLTALKEKSRQLPTFPLKSSIIGVRELDFRVRYGNGYCLSTMATGIYYQINQQGPLEHLLLHGFGSVAHFVCLVSSATRFQSFLMKFSYSKRR